MTKKPQQRSRKTRRVVKELSPQEVTRNMMANTIHEPGGTVKGATRSLTPTRQKILEAAISHTVGARDVSYGAPVLNLSCAEELCEVFERYARRNPHLDDVPPAFWEAVHQVLTKLSRIANGIHKADNYEDGCAYLAIAGEMAVMRGWTPPKKLS